MYEFLLIISPNEQVLADVSNFKNELLKGYGRYKAAYSEGHITLINFVQTDLNEKFIVKTLELFSKSIKPFTVDLCGFGQFSSRTLFINVQSKKPIRDLLTNLKSGIGKTFQFDKVARPRFSGTPHLTLIRGMAQEKFNDAWRQWQNKTYAASFYACEMLLLKRALGGNDKFKEVKRFEFGGKDDQLLFEFPERRI